MTPQLPLPIPPTHDNIRGPEYFDLKEVKA